VSRQVTPDDGTALDPEAVAAPASPSEDQGGDATAEPTPANTQPRLDDPALLQRAFTQSQQRWSDLRKGLGLPKDATPDDVLAAIAQQRAARDDDEDESAPAPLSPAAVLEAEARAEAAEWRYYAAVYPETAVAAREFADFARQEKDPESLTLKFYEILNRFTDQGTGQPASGDAGGSAPQAAAAQAQGQGVIDIGAGESPAADIQPEDAAALERLRGSGKVAEGLRHIPGWDRMMGRPAN